MPIRAIVMAIEAEKFPGQNFTGEPWRERAYRAIGAIGVPMQRRRPTKKPTVITGEIKSTIAKPKRTRRDDGMMSHEEAAAFYRSYEWRRLRYEVLQDQGRKCALCGATPPAIVLHVDHIKPLRANWGRRLDKTNLQVLCEVCNHGKGNWDQTDWRGDV